MKVTKFTEPVVNGAHRAADWILASQKQSLAKAAVVLWVVAQSVLTPLWTVWKERDQARREGLTEVPRLVMTIDKAGECVAINRSPRPLIMLELRRFLHTLDPSKGCVRQAGFDRPIAPAERTPTLEPGGFVELPVATQAEKAAIQCPPKESCLIECEAVFHRAVDLFRFERVTFAGVSAESKVVFPITEIASTPRLGGGETWSFAVNQTWKAAFECAQEQRGVRKQMDDLMDRFLDVRERVVQGK